MRKDTGWSRRGAVAVGGALGTLARYALTGLAAPGGFPLATLTVNLAGAFLLGVALGLVVPLGRPHLSTLLTTGLLGSFTTFSAFAVEVVQLTPHRPGIALSYLLVSLVAGPAAARAGLTVGRRRS